MTHSSHHPETRVISTVEYGAIEIGFWRVGSSFLKLGVKSGKVGSSFLKNRNPPHKNLASPPAAASGPYMHVSIGRVRAVLMI